MDWNVTSLGMLPFTKRHVTCSVLLWEIRYEKANASCCRCVDEPAGVRRGLLHSRRIRLWSVVRPWLLGRAWVLCPIRIRHSERRTTQARYKIQRRRGVHQWPLRRESQQIEVQLFAPPCIQSPPPRARTV